jgi:hypothetical protein
MGDATRALFLTKGRKNILLDVTQAVPARPSANDEWALPGTFLFLKILLRNSVHTSKKTHHVSSSRICY